MKAENFAVDLTEDELMLSSSLKIAFLQILCLRITYSIQKAKALTNQSQVLIIDRLCQLELVLPFFEKAHCPVTKA
jgi:hypothetical protein